MGKTAPTGSPPYIINNLAIFYKTLSISIKASEALSQPVRITKGVLPGDPLSPLLFILYLSDLPRYMQSRHAVKTQGKTFKLLIYADDIVIFSPSIQLLNKALKILHKYLTINCLTLNPEKSKAIIFRKKKSNTPPPNVIYNNIIIEISFIWLNQSPTLLTTLLPSIHDRLISLAIQSDSTALSISTHYQNYVSLNSIGKPSCLLQLNLPLRIHRLLAQIRILGFPSLMNGFTNFFDKNSPCKLCAVELEKTEDLFHIIYICEAYDILRSSELPNQVLPPTSRELFFDIFKQLDYATSLLIFQICKFITKRSLLLSLCLD